MKEFEELNTEKQEELLSVIECCKVSESEFEQKVDLLSLEDKKTVFSYMIDHVYKFVEDKDDDNIKNKNVLSFLKNKKYKPILTELFADFNKNEIDPEQEKKIQKNLEKLYDKYPTFDLNADRNMEKFRKVIFCDNFEEEFNKLSENEKLLLCYDINDFYDVDIFKKFMDPELPYYEHIEKYLIDSFLIP